MLHPARTHRIESELIDRFGLMISMLRLDEMHPEIGGNKWFKLKYNIEEAKRNKAKGIITFGGAFSNHIAATAAAGRLFGIPTIGIVRGEERAAENPTLKDAAANGMQLHFISREDYARRYEDEFLRELRRKFDGYFFVPEGGNNLNGIRGAIEIVSKIAVPFDVLTTAVGTGSTLAGMTFGLQGNQEVIGFSALKGAGDLDNHIDEKISEFQFSGMDGSRLTPGKWTLNHEFHFGGYAKRSDELLVFTEQFYFAHGVQLDYVYTAKMMFGLSELVAQGYFTPGTRIVAVHTGGLQGNRGYSSL